MLQSNPFHAPSPTSEASPRSCHTPGSQQALVCLEDQSDPQGKTEAKDKC